MKIRTDFVSNSSSCSFFVGLHTQADIDEFKKFVDMLKKKNVYMQLFYNLAEAKDRWYGHDFDGSDEAVASLEPGNYILIDTGDDHYDGYEYRFWDIEDRLTESYPFKLYRDKEAHMSVSNELPKEDKFDQFFKENWD